MKARLRPTVRMLKGLVSKSGRVRMVVWRGLQVVKRSGLWPGGKSGVSG